MRVAILGGTGIVGQRFVSLLSNHPWFEIVSIVASEDKVGKKYREGVHRVLEEPIPESISELTLSRVGIESIIKKDVDIVFSALPSHVASRIEPELLKEDVVVISNSSPYRMDPKVPLVNPEVNASHLDLLKAQNSYKWAGSLVKVPNCSSAIITLAIKPLLSKIKIRNNTMIRFI